MAGLLNANLPSEDEEDDDFRVDAAEGAGKAARKRPRRGQAASDEAGASGQPAAAADDEEEEEQHAGPAERAKKAKVDALWQQLQGQAGSTSKARPKPSLSSLERRAPASSSKSKGAADLLWMRSLGITPPSSGKAAASASKKPAGTATPQPKPAAEAEPGSKPAAAAETDRQGEAAAADGANATPPAGAADADTASPAAAATQGQPGGGTSSTSASKAAMAAAAIAAAREAATKGVAAGYNTVTITETRKFAGKDIAVQLQVDKDSKAAKQAAERQKAVSSGLDAFLQDIEKKKKVTVLDKTKMDWQELKATNANLEEELETHKRSDKQYLDKQDFLKRAELREYEAERDSRMAGRRAA